MGKFLKEKNWKECQLAILFGYLRIIVRCNTRVRGALRFFIRQVGFRFGRCRPDGPGKMKSPGFPALYREGKRRRLFAELFPVFINGYEYDNGRSHEGEDYPEIDFAAIRE